MKTDITEKLDQWKIPYKIKPHCTEVYTSEEAARQRGVKLSQIVKTMMLEDKNGRISVAVLPGDRRLDLKKIKEQLAVKDLRFVNRETVEQKLGMVVGAIAPIADHFTDKPIFVDPAVFQEDLVDISSGDPMAGLELKSHHLKRLLPDAVVVQITRKTS